MDEAIKPYRMPKPPETWTKNLSFFAERFFDSVTFPESAGGEFDQYRNRIALSGRAEILTYRDCSDIPERSVEPATVEFNITENPNVLTFGDENYYAYGHLVVLDSMLELPDGKKCDELCATIGITLKMFDALRQRFSAISGNTSSLIINLSIIGLGLDWTRKGKLPIVGVSLNWQGIMPRRGG